MVEREPASSIATRYEDLLPYTGTSSRRALGRVCRQEFERYAVACGDSDPRWFDDAAAQAAGMSGAAAPPLFLTSVMGWESGPHEHDLRSDGTSGDELAGLPIAGLQVMGGGQDLEFGAPVIDGTEVELETTVDRVELHEGRTGQVLVIELTRVFQDVDGRMLVRCQETFLVRDTP